MARERPNRLWLVPILLLTLAIIAGAFMLWLRYEPAPPVEITLSRAPGHSGIIHVSGAVANPGLYPFIPADSIESLLNAAGGAANSANFNSIKLIFTPDGTPGPQRVDINRADAWLLEALPGVGPTLAQRIVDYREKNGLYRSTADLLKVSGLGDKTYQQIIVLVTVGD